MPEANKEGEVCKNCKEKDGLIERQCLKEKLESWFDKRTIIDLLNDSGIDPLTAIENFDKFEVLPESNLLFAIRNLHSTSYRKRLFNISIPINEQLNNCILKKDQRGKYRFDDYGVLKNISYLDVKSARVELNDSKALEVFLATPFDSNKYENIPEIGNYLLKIKNLLNNLVCQELSEIEGKKPEEIKLSTEGGVIGNKLSKNKVSALLMIFNRWF